jgi:hypothetical protein
MRSINKVLVLGFSVTGGKDSYVEQAETLEDWPENVNVCKVAIGGLMPAWIKFFAADIIDSIKPDAVVLELATPTFRQDPNLQTIHKTTLEWLLDLCNHRGLAAGILDLPRTDVDATADWVNSYHATTAKNLGLAYRSVVGRPDMFWDIVHPTEIGKAIYADVFCDMVREIVATPQVPPSYDPGIKFFAIPVKQNTASRTFDRAGFVADVIDMAQGEVVVQKLRPQTRLVGLSFLMGPKTGFFEVTAGDKVFEVPAYDQHCYYERFGARLFHPVKATEVTITQTSTLSKATLAKGEPDLGPRVGSLAHLLMEEETQS